MTSCLPERTMGPGPAACFTSSAIKTKLLYRTCKLMGREVHARFDRESGTSRVRVVCLCNTDEANQKQNRLCSSLRKFNSIFFEAFEQRSALAL